MRTKNRFAYSPHYISVSKEKHLIDIYIFRIHTRNEQLLTTLIIQTMTRKVDSLTSLNIHDFINLTNDRNLIV